MFIIRLIIFVYIMMCMSLYIPIYVCTYIGVDHVCGCICTLVCIVNLFYYDNVFLIIEVKKTFCFSSGRTRLRWATGAARRSPPPPTPTPPPPPASGAAATAARAGRSTRSWRSRCRRQCDPYHRCQPLTRMP